VYHRCNKISEGHEEVANWPYVHVQQIAVTDVNIHHVEDLVF
jgi:hypothetical protein